jgi:hypothetical protein
MQSQQIDTVDVKILLNAIATLSKDKDLDTIRGHLADFKTLIECCSGKVSIAWPDGDWKKRNGTVGGSGCHTPTK